MGSGRNLDIVMASAECAPLAKAGGLGDAVPGLAHELARHGVRVELILPDYDVLRTEALNDLHTLSRPVQVMHRGQPWPCRVRIATLGALRCVLIGADAPEAFFQRGRLYGEPDDAARFAFFSRALLAYLSQSGRHPDIIHCHDWQTALVPVLLNEVYRAAGLAHSRVCLTLHNLGYQGLVGPDILHQVGLDAERLMVPERLLDPQGRLANLLKGGILEADFVNTVSPHYAWEVLHSEQGMGLQGVLQAVSHKFGGILNGLDPEAWNPASDSLIPVPFDEERLALKVRNRAALRERLGLREREAPILAVVSRLDRQKGVELIAHGIERAHASGAQVVLLGAALEPEITRRFERLRERFAPDPDVHLELGYDEALAHLIYAGSDLILIPSLYEPCGLTQLIAMRYGTVPIARRVGGLADTLFDANDSDRPFGERNAYLFDDPTPSALDQALARALQLWRDHPHYFYQLRLNGMRADHTWRLPAEDYLDLYAFLLGD